MKNTILSFALPLLLALSPASASADRLLWVGVDGAATIGDTTVSQYQVAGNAIDSFRITVPDEESLVFAYDGNDGALVVDDTTALNFGAGVAEWATLNLADNADPDLVVTMELGNNSGSAFKPMAIATETLGNLTNAPHVSLQADLNPPAMTPWTPANFTAVGVWTISYDLDGGTNDDANPTNYNVFTDLPITLNDATRDGYTFAGWTNELGEVVSALAADSTGDRFFGATWLENVEVPTLEDKSYNGELQTADVPENAGYTVTANAGGTDADNYTVTLSLNAGYAWSDGSTNDQTVTWAITPIEATVEIVGASATATFDGTAHTVRGYTATASTPLYDVDHDIAFSGSAEATRTVFGTEHMGLAAEQFSNTNPNFSTVTFTVTTDGFQAITRKAVTVTAADKSKVTGNADPELTATVTGLVDGESESLISYTLSRAEGEDVGSYAITVSGDAEQGNYAVTFVPGTFTISGAVAMRISADGTTTNYYATLADAVAAAQDGETVQLLADVTLDSRIEPNVGEGKALTIDLGGFKVTREGTDGNGSAFDVKSGSVVITNGVIDCAQDDTAIAKDGVYAITVRSGADVTLADLDVTVDSECGACAYPFAGASLTIESGTYANTTTVPYRYKPEWTGMAVNQANVAETLITITGGAFSQVDPALGDDSAPDGTMSFVDDDYVTVLEGGAYVVYEAVTVTFVTDKGDVPEAQRIGKGKTATEPDPAPECENWAFNYWTLDGTEYDFTTPVTEDIELVADWRPTRQTVTFDPSPYGTFRGAPTTNMIFEIGETYHDLPNTTPDGTHARIGWYTLPDGQGGDPVVNGDDVTVEAERTLYAHWTDKQTVTFEAQNGKDPSTKIFMVGGRYGSLPTPKWAGHAFLGWFTQADGGKKLSATSIVTTRPTRTMYAHWTTEQTVIFDAQGGECNPSTMVSTIGGRYGSLPKPTRAGYVFEGWYTKADGGNHLTANSIVTTLETRTFYAHWTNEQTIVFDAQGGVCDPPTRVCTMGGRVGSLPKPTWEYHVFLGWFTEPEGGKQFSANSLVTTAKTRTMYAHWLNEQVVTFEPLNGTESWTEVYTMGDRFGALPKPTWDFHAFLGWYTEPEGGDHFTWLSIVTTARTRTMYGQWTTNQLVTFDPQGGTCDTETMVVTIGETYGELPVPVKEGHKFLGWYTRVEGGMKMSAARVVNTVANRTLYAHWEEKQASGLAITGFSAKKSGGVAARGGRGQASAAVLTFEAEAGCVYELQWTPMLGGEWTTLRRWTADSDGEESVEVPGNPGESSGFYRLAMPSVPGE